MIADMKRHHTLALERVHHLAVLVMMTVFTALSTPAASAQAVDPADVASPEAIVAAAYAALARAPGENFDWDRMRGLFLPEARLIPNTEQRGGELSIMSPEEFIAWIESVTVIGGANDPGFVEGGVNNIVEQYGDVAHVFSTYEKHFWNNDQVIGAGINSFQLVRNDGRWWIVGIVWDEPSGAGPIPGRYTASGAARSQDPDAVYEAFSRAYETLDIDLLRAQYTPDCLYLPAGGGTVPVQTCDDAMAGFEAMFARAKADGRRLGISFRFVDRSVSGDLAYDVGYYDLVSAPADSTDASTERHSFGKFVVVQKRQADGSWRIHTDGFSPTNREAYEDR